ncbi:hypothetical protein MCI89_13655 [Muricomes sp. OA1]|uniref:Uncharacterized protein n=1 Tax=Hungatella hathewayi TaxID=154046 RepID=A0A3E2WVC3_9FIRM|nr:MULTISPECIES: hypothetical protein [Clostridia]MCH1973389.1 hypothetical protein [Muricomes sp. OA1]MRM87028.1 hypothetical protein [Faecalicatena contorta]RGC31581.1 hypothetical protein DWX41_12275 [Hungatella hathewayi]GKH32245.1 hypothetical protein CE91St64_16520 [Faecalicatena contorta]
MDRRTEWESWRFPLDVKRKKESLGKIGQAVEKKQIRKYPSLAANIRSQFKFQSWKYWALQGGILVAAMALVLYLSRVEADGEGAISVCAVFLVFAGNIGLSGLGRLFSRNMAELEQTLYLNLKQMVCIQMLFGGAADLLVLGMIVGIAGGQNEAGAGACLLYMLVPFLWSDLLYLYMLTAFRSIWPGFWQVSAGLIGGLLALIPVFLKDAYKAVYLPVWGVLAAAGCLLLAAEILYMLEKIERGEGLCLN